MTLEYTPTFRLKIVLHYKSKPMEDNVIARQSIIITGGSNGLGYECAKAIAQSKKPWLIIIASRNLSRVEHAVEQLISETAYPHIQGMVLDLASLQSVRQFVQQLVQMDIPPLKGLVCNAGIQIISETKYTKDGFEATFGVNHLGHFLLVNLLLSQMTEFSRIIFVSSDAHDPRTKTGMPAPQYKSPNQMAFSKQSDTTTNIGNIGRYRYTTSKLCNLLCTYELAKRLQNYPTTIWVNAFNPGLMLDTNLARGYNQKETFKFLLDSFPDLLCHILRFGNSKKMGKALASLILNSDLDGVSGKYFDGFKQVESSVESHNTYKAVELWEVSTTLVQLDN